MLLDPCRSITRCFAPALVFIILLMPFGAVRLAHAQGPGGFTESATGNGLRPRLSSGEIQSFIPARGRFAFPAPYGTTGIRLTNASDCGGGDCVNYVGYSYWRNINNHAGSDTMLIFLGLERRRGGSGPTLFSYNKNNGETRNLGALFSEDNPFAWSSGEGWYFSATRPHALYINDSTRLLRYDVSSRSLETVFDVTQHLGSDKKIRQMHSSSDDRVHSATVQDAGWNATGCVAYVEDQRRAVYVAKKGDYDECQIDKSGRWLVIKENVDGRDGEDNRIVDLQSGAETVFYDRDGAAGHSDVGYGYMVAEDNFYHLPGTARVWQFGQDMRASGQGAVVYNLSGSDWPAGGLGHVSHTNAKAGVPPGQQMACSSSAERSNVPRINEIVCYRLDGSRNTLVVAPNMTDLNASGGGSDDYAKRPKGNLDPTGEYFIWTTNLGTNRADAFIVRIPSQRLAVSAGDAAAAPAPTPTPSPAPTSPAPAPTPDPAQPAPAPGPEPTAPIAAGGMQWVSLINVAVSGNGLVKTGGCGGCPDAAAVSEQQLTGNGVLEFVAADARSLVFVGLGPGGIGTTAGDLHYAIRLQAGTAEVRELGGYRTEVSFGAGDTFRMSVEGGVVRYLKNGTPFYTSASPVASALRVHAVLFDANATVGSLTLGQAAVAVASPVPPTASAVDDPVPMTPEPAPVEESAPAFDEYGTELYKYVVR